MTEEKVKFLTTDYLIILGALPLDRQGSFGKMNVMQMVEHMTWAFKLANGSIQIPNTHTPELTKKMHSFMMSDKPFRENTPNRILPDEPELVRAASLSSAISALEKEILQMIQVYNEDKYLRIENPFFGMLNYAEQVQLLHKHAMHHLRQFKAMP